MDNNLKWFYLKLNIQHGIRYVISISFWQKENNFHPLKLNPFLKFLLVNSNTITFEI